MGLRITVVQPSVTDSFEENLESVKSIISNAGKDSPDIVVLPEAWQHSNTIRNSRTLAKRLEETLEVLRRLAVELNCVVVGGGLVVERSGGLRVSAPVISHTGEVIGWQDKIHLHKSEKNVFVGGEEIKVFSHRGIVFGVQICVDIAFPELSRIMALRGADLMLNPSRMPSSAIDAWHSYLAARCLENRVAAAAPNVYVISGGSVLMNLRKKGETVFQVEKTVVPEGENHLTMEIELMELRKARRERLAARKPYLYGEVIKPVEETDLFYRGSVIS